MSPTFGHSRSLNLCLASNLQEVQSFPLNMYIFLGLVKAAPSGQTGPFKVTISICEQTSDDYTNSCNRLL